MAEKEQAKRLERPDLRNINPYPKQLRLVVLGCALVVLYMYPTIIRPSLSIGVSDDESEISEKKRLLDRARPSFMPQWSNPFARSPGSDDE